MTNDWTVRGVALLVRDLDLVARFYAEVIGLAALDAAPGRMVLGAGGVALVELLHRPMALPREQREAGLFHTAFLLPGRADLGRFLAHLASCGIRLDGAADHLVSEAVYLSDPEGNGVEVYADRAASEWRWTEAGPGGERRVTMANARLDQAGLLALAAGENGTPWHGAPAGTRVGHVHLQVGDAAEATAFLTGTLGLDVTAAWGEAAFLSSGGYHHHLAVNTWNSQGCGMRSPDRAGLAAVTLVRPDFHSATGPATDSGSARPDIQDPWGTRIRLRSTNEESLFT